jgi:hypothetical protein
MTMRSVPGPFLFDTDWRRRGCGEAGTAFGEGGSMDEWEEVTGGKEEGGTGEGDRGQRHSGGRWLWTFRKNDKNED